MIATPLTADLVRGALELEPGEYGVVPHRLPTTARLQNVDPQLAMAQSQPSGVRVVFTTTSTVVELETVPTKREYVGMPPRPDGAYELVMDGRLLAAGSVVGGRVLVIDMTTGGFEQRDGGPGRVRFDDLPSGEKTLEIWLPHDETTELVALWTDTPVEPVVPGGQPVWLHHGSSISQGSNASRPTAIWPVVAAQAAGVQLVNLGFGGGAMLDPFTARAIRDAPADRISLELGINLVNADLFRLRALGPAVHGFLDTIREGHPTTPLVVVSALLCPTHEDNPGPATAELVDGRVMFRAVGDPSEVAAGRLTLAVVRRELERVVASRAARDPHLRYLDGRELYGEADAEEHPLPDALHPDEDTHRLIGERFARLGLGLVSST